MKVRKVVLPVAGWGTRSLPASKAIPKEMLPVFNKPVIQYVVEEAVRAGIEQVIFVTNRHKRVIEDHFDRSLDLEDVLEESGKFEQLLAIQQVASLVEVMSVRQKVLRGLGHAVGCTQGMVGDDFFAVMLGDDFIDGENDGLVELVRAAEKYNMPAIGVMEVPADKINKYGIVAGQELAEGVYKITEMVEKPAIGSINSNLAIVGRYILPKEIYEYISRVKPGKGDEIQLTDALAAYAQDKGMLAVKMHGRRFDTGDWVQYLTAGIYFGLKDKKLREPLLLEVQKIIDENK